ncbi:MAG: flagellar biosynthesis protein FliQ [Alphaproteobacteria bacterium]|nr:flagellar biosynthesis protein FliQ [Alphaproteobacteria bacterium]
MNEAQVMDFAREAVFTMLKVATPIMIVGLIVGLVISLFQALTSIQEMTLTFVPKILVVFTSLLVLLPYMFETMQRFMESVADRIVGIG